jgi:hypothetical protein
MSPALFDETTTHHDDLAVVAAERAALQAEREQLERDRETLARERAQAQGVQTSKAKVDLTELDQAARADRYCDWPSSDLDMPQPWDLQAQGLDHEASKLDPGARNTVAPVVVEHCYPTLTSGSADPAVHELGRMLADLGHPNSVSRGENPFGAVDQTILAAVYAFRAEHNVEEDPSGFGGHTPAGRTLAAAHIGPWTWEAVRRAHARR